MKKLILSLVLLIAGMCHAANEVQVPYAHSNNLYFRVFDSTGKVWNTALGTPAFQNWSDAQVANYDIALTGTGGSFYLGTFPSLSDGRYTVIAYLRAGGTPAVNDGVISSGFMEWRSSAEVDWGALIDLIDTLAALFVNLAMPSTQAGSQP